jgi:hypothetical protein
MQNRTPRKLESGFPENDLSHPREAPHTRAQPTGKSAGLENLGERSRAQPYRLTGAENPPQHQTAVTKRTAPALLAAARTELTTRASA